MKYIRRNMCVYGVFCMWKLFIITRCGALFSSGSEMAKKLLLMEGGGNAF